MTRRRQLLLLLLLLLHPVLGPVQHPEDFSLQAASGSQPYYGNLLPLQLLRSPMVSVHAIATADMQPPVPYPPGPKWPHYRPT
jgi:hypothetical protein